jgi:hypothetical protein
LAAVCGTRDDRTLSCTPSIRHVWKPRGNRFC